MVSSITGGSAGKLPAGSNLGTECAAVLILQRYRGNAEGKDFNVTIVNTNNVPDSGFDYHAVRNYVYKHMYICVYICVLIYINIYIY
jgi:hypothetical protein